MNDAAPAIFVALEASAFAAAIRQSTWIYPLANVGHVVVLTVFAGAVAIMDVRLLGGMAATAPAKLIGRARSVALVALLGMAATGFVLFAAEASHVAVNAVFLFKVALIVTGVVNVAIYEFGAKHLVQALPPGAAMPAVARRTGMLSIGIWLAVAACGRSIAYF
jgi:hypothetical protein